MLRDNKNSTFGHILGRIGKGQQTNDPVLTWWIEKKERIVSMTYNQESQ